MNQNPKIEICCPTCASFCKGKDRLQHKVLPYCRHDPNNTPGPNHSCIGWRPRKSVVEKAVIESKLKGN